MKTVFWLLNILNQEKLVLKNNEFKVLKIKFTSEICITTPITFN